MLTFHIFNVYVYKTQQHQFKFTFKSHPHFLSHLNLLVVRSLLLTAVYIRE